MASLALAKESKDSGNADATSSEKKVEAPAKKNKKNYWLRVPFAILVFAPAPVPAIFVLMADKKKTIFLSFVIWFIILAIFAFWFYPTFLSPYKH